MNPTRIDGESLFDIAEVELLAWLETYSLAWSDGNLSTRARVAANAGFSGPDSKHAKPAQFDAVAFCQSLLQAAENGVDCLLCLGTGQTRPLDYLVHYILLDHVRRSGRLK